MTYLYRIWGGEQLLYVGISKSFLKRFSEHMATQAWANDITSLTCKVYATRGEAISAEKKAVEEEKPKHNKYLQKKVSRRCAAEEQWAAASLEDRQNTLQSLRKIVGVRFEGSTDRDDNVMGRLSRLLVLTDGSSPALTWEPPTNARQPTKGGN